MTIAVVAAVWLLLGVVVARFMSVAKDDPWG